MQKRWSVSNGDKGLGALTRERREAGPKPRSEEHGGDHAAMVAR